MAVITFTNLDDGAGAFGGPTFVLTNSISPSANKVVYVWVANHPGSGTPEIPTLSGNGITWNLEDTRRSVSSDNKRFSLFKGVSASPTSGVILIDCGVQGQDSILWSINQADNAKVTGTTIQTKSDDSTSNNTGMTLNFDTPTIAGNAVLAGFYCDGTPGATPVLPFIQLSVVQDHGEVEAMYSSSNQDSVSWTWGINSSPKIIMAAEIAAQVDRVGSMLQMFK